MAHVLGFHMKNHEKSKNCQKKSKSLIDIVGNNFLPFLDSWTADEIRQRGATGSG